ncbi:MAG: 2,5-dichloro-2,5-cyclohexadiene-1,4-diol dehydrogenase [Sneathiella sp.]|jgi:NAD(P)-dependent dehydrogenase (short-subunit alcohol dehydrogenase family)|uniref:SDR family NAD(P)-dependent oxidoreductase n=1 Tax=Sneathiella sp. TaxID=1964365 RepID=UPI000C56CA2D|nr:SDR family oxidoreductase [Sneathiella sp.]MAL78670.1 2,5-dichloro-2,5-cyclohexadiene-1,4-diol dehydrogenase [Sneathiella sp.]
MARLQGKVTVITGGTSGIGLRTVEIFANEGATVVFSGRRETEGRKIAEKLGDAVHFVRADASVEADMQSLILGTAEKFGRLDCLFNNAGGPAPVGSIETVDFEKAMAAMRLLFGGVLLGIKHAAPIMKKQGFGSIINNGSIAGHLAGYSTSMVYSSAKAAVLQLTRSAAMELGESNVRVNSISPGAIATGIFGKALGLTGQAAEDTAEIAGEVLAKAQPIQRAGLPDDIAKAALFLASDDSTFINAADILVDGGMIGGRHWTAHQESVKGLGKAFSG